MTRVFDHATRIERLQSLMTEAGVDGVVLSIGADLPYLIGYEAMESERLTALVVVQNAEPTLLVPRLEAPRVRSGPFGIHAWDEGDDPVSLVAGALGDPSRVLVGDHMWSRFLLELQSGFHDVDWGPGSELTQQLRLEKTAEEVAALQAAANGVDRVLARIPDEIGFAGRTESEVARDITEMVVEEGHDRALFWIVASGPNGASPHHEPSDRVIQQGDLVVCDFGGSIDGYHSDVTRTFVVGHPTAEQRDVHAVVAAANEAGREAVTPGVTAESVDRAARAVIEDAGLGAYFIHRTGHGIGMEVHEQPYIVDGNQQILGPGMAFSIEPGVYLPGEFGVRIEDIVVVTTSGSETLNTASRDLIGVS